MKIKWLRIYKRYLNMSKVGALSAYNEMMHDYWNGAIPGVPRGRYGEVPHGASYGQLVAELRAHKCVAHLVDDEPEDPRHICDMWLSFWSVVFCVSFAFEIVSLFTGNRFLGVVCLSVMVFSLAMCTFLSIKNPEVK